MSRRFPLDQGDKVRMIDHYSVFGVNDSCTIHTKLDLHMVDNFVAVVKAYFSQKTALAQDCSLVVKTYDLKSAYHLKYEYFCIYNPEIKSVEVYCSRTMPFGAIHSVYSFLRLAKMLHSVACRGPKLITTNFHDDFILASHPLLQESSKNCMEFVFLSTGWAFAKDGRKATEFSRICSALGVSFNLTESKDGILEVQNTAR